jgi:hypothetical protein
MIYAIKCSIIGNIGNVINVFIALEDILQQVQDERGERKREQL